MNRNDGGAAFPMAGHVIDGGIEPTQYGMSLRDWFAGQVLAVMHIRAAHEPGLASPEQRAKLAYIDADAMLKAREQS